MPLALLALRGAALERQAPARASEIRAGEMSPGQSIQLVAFKGHVDTTSVSMPTELVSAQRAPPEDMPGAGQSTAGGEHPFTKTPAAVRSSDCSRRSRASAMPGQRRPTSLRPRGGLAREASMDACLL